MTTVGVTPTLEVLLSSKNALAGIFGDGCFDRPAQAQPFSDFCVDGATLTGRNADGSHHYHQFDEEEALLTQMKKDPSQGGVQFEIKGDQSPLTLVHLLTAI